MTKSVEPVDTGCGRLAAPVTTVPVAQPGRPSAAQARFLPNPRERDDSVEGQVARLQTMMDKEEDEKAGETSGLLDKPDSSSSGGAEPEPDVTKLAPLLCRRIPGVYIPVFCVSTPDREC